MDTAWDSCIAAVGADGIVSILSLQAGGFCQRMLPGHPPGVRLHLQWASSLGFLACLSPAPAPPSSSSLPLPPPLHRRHGGAVAIVWDLQSGACVRACPWLSGMLS